MPCKDDCEAAETLRQMREAMRRPRYFAPVLGLSKSLSRALALLYKRELVSAETLAVGSSAQSPAELKDPNSLAKVMVHKLRQRLNPYGIGIHTRYGEGFYMTPENKQRLERFIIRI